MRRSGASLPTHPGEIESFDVLAAAVLELAGAGSVEATIATAAEAARRVAGADTFRTDPAGFPGEAPAAAIALTIWAHGAPHTRVLLERAGRPFDEEERRLAELTAVAASLALTAADRTLDLDLETADLPGVGEAAGLLQPFVEVFSKTTGVSPTELAAAAAAAADASGVVLARLAESEAELEIVAMIGLPEEIARRWRRTPIDADSPIAEAVRAQQPLFLERDLFGADGGWAVVVPLSAAGRRLGVLGLAYEAPRSFGEREREHVAALGALTARALDRLQRDLLHDLTRRLQEVTATLASARTQAEIAEAIVVEGVGALGATAGIVGLIDEGGHELRVAASQGYPPGFVEAFTPLALEAPLPLSEAARQGEMVLLESPAEVDERYPDISARRGRRSENAVAALPLVAGEAPLGAVGFSFAEARAFDHDERAFLLALSRLCAQALDRAQRARLYDRSARLQAIASGLAQAVTPADVAGVVLDEGIRVLGARGGRVAIHAREGSGVRTLAARGFSDELLEDVQRRGLAAEMPLGVAATTGEPVLIESLEAVKEDWPRVAEVFAATGDRAIAALPLHSRGALLGGVGFSFAEPQTFAEEDVSFFGALAGLCEQALDRAQLFEAVTRSRDRLNHLLNHLGEGVVAVDDGLVVTYANREASEMLGSGAPLVGAELPDEWPGLRLRELARSLLGQGSEPCDEKRELDDGRTMQVLGVPGDDLATLVLRDVTRRERQERAEREFVANAAHELRSPLAAIGAAIDALQRGAKDSPQDRDFYLAGVTGEVDRLNRLAHALLLLARTQSDPESLRLGRVDVEALVTDVAARLDARPGVRVTASCEPGTVAGERALLEAAVSNVARNAARHTDSGTIALSCRRVGDDVVIEVADTGAGMPHAIRERATERFFRGVDRDRGGFGLGLPLAQEMVRALGGTLAIVSEPGVGTAVKISLPSV